jgi:hypothetical protein
MKLPKLDNPPAYQGLYVFDFGGQVAVGYTAAEVAVLLDSEAHRGGKVYRIHRAHPDGTMELRGVPASRFQLETGLFFCSGDPDRAAADFADLARLAQEHPFPCRAKLQRGHLPGSAYPHAVAVIYPAEYDEDVSAWMLARDYRGGEIAEGGTGHVTDWYARAEIAERLQLHGAAGRADRTPDEVLASVGRAVQRQAV